MAIAIDTLAYARRLREAGFSEKQAEGQAEALAAAMTDTLATKQDLRELETRVDARFAQLDTRITELDRRMDERLTSRLNEQTSLFRAEMADLERRMTTRLGGITVAGIGVVSALVKVL
jgi:DNA anti-recombination protein RmuC